MAPRTYCVEVRNPVPYSYTPQRPAYPAYRPTPAYQPAPTYAAYPAQQTYNQERPTYQASPSQAVQPNRNASQSEITASRVLQGLNDAAVVAQGVTKTLDLLETVWDFLEELAAAIF